MDTTRVLNLVKENKITIEQADELLKALQGAQPNPPSAASAFEPKAPAPRPARAVGKGPYSFMQMIELSKFGVDADFVRELKELGLEQIDFEDVIEFGKFGVDADFIREMRDLGKEFGMEELDTHTIIELSKFGVDADYVREMLQSGMLDIDSLKHGLRESNQASIEEQRGKIERKLAKARAKLSQASDKTGRTRLQEIIDELEAEMVDLNDQEREMIELELEDRNT